MPPRRPSTLQPSDFANPLWMALSSAPSFCDPAQQSALAAKALELVLAGADPEHERPNRLSPQSAWESPIAFAIRRRWSPVALALIPFCDPLRVCKGSQNCDLLMDACSMPEVIDALLLRGADARRVDDAGRSALMYALRFDSAAPGPDGLRPSIRLLLPASDPFTVDRDGKTLEDWASHNAAGPHPFEMGALRSRREAEALAACASQPSALALARAPRL